MTDNTAWQPPGGPANNEPGVPPVVPPVVPPPAAGSPFIPPPVAPPADAPPPAFTVPGAPPQQGGPAYGPTPTPGWTPPPKPGLIPLRPLTLGTILGASFQVLRRNPRPMFGFSLLLTGGVFVLTLLVIGLFTFWGISRIASASSEDSDAVAAGGIATIILGSLVPLAFSVAVLAILQGVVVLEVARGTLGEKLTLRGLLHAARGRIWALIGWSMLASAVVIAAIVIVALIIVVLVSFGGAAGIAVAVLIGILAALGAVVVGFWLSTRLSMVPIAIVIERLPLRQAIRRSWSLTTGYFWKILGIQLLVGVILGTANQIISTPISFVFIFATNLINSQGDDNTGIILAVVSYIVLIIASVVIGAVTVVVQSATTGLLYIDLRMRKEGLDIELARFVEARQAGDTSVPDPYLLRPASAPAV